MKRPFAVFDIDGTLIRWQLYHALADELARAGLLEAAGYQRVRAARMTWKNRANSAAFQAYEEELVQLIDSAIKSVSIEDFLQACRSVVEVYKDQAYTYTRDLIGKLKAQNYLLFAISASQVEIVGLVAEYYGFDDFGGSRYTVKDGHFTGHKAVLRREKKLELLRELAAKHSAGWHHSLGVGDSESDIPMLSAVEQPIAFNPTKQLFEHARSQHWKIVLERKSVIYELVPDDNSYRLVGNG